jgi:uncharacterized membrane protein YczE
VITPPVVRGGLAVRAVALIFGLGLFAIGIVLQLESSLGLGPWDVLSQGIASRTPFSFGTVTVIVSFVVLAIAWGLGARIGAGTLANAVLVGSFIDALLAIDAIDELSEQPLAIRVAMLVAGILIVGLGSGFYLGASFGAGPRDSLMLVAARRTGTRMGIVRAALELGVGALGFALGGTIGVGTLAFALGVGPAVELGCAALIWSGIASAGDRSASVVTIGAEMSTAAAREQR